MTFRIVLVGFLFSLGFAHTASARSIPPVELTVSGDASPELLADFRQALQRSARRQPEEVRSKTLAATAGHIDLEQFWKVEQDIAYTEAEESPRQRLNIVFPFEGEPPYRFIVFFHGGDWQSGDNRAASDAAAYWAIYQGYALVSVNYRLADEAHWPAQLHDAKAALRFLRANAERYQLDASRIVVWGSGSGGHLAQMLGATSDDPTQEDPTMGYGEASSEVQGVVSWAGISDVTDMTPDTQEAADQLLGYPAYQSDTALEASPVAQVHEAYPPILLVHGTNDGAVAFEQSARMALRVNAATNDERASLKLLINAGHVDEDFISPEVMAQSLDFVDAILYPDDKNPYRSAFYPGIQTVGDQGGN